MTSCSGSTSISSEYLKACKLAWTLLGYKGEYVGFPAPPPDFVVWKYRLTHWSGHTIWISK